MAVLALVAVQMAALSPLFRSGDPAGDDLSIHLAEIRSLVDALRAGDLGLWNPSANLGFPSGYYYQLAPQLLVAIAAAAVEPAVGLVTLFKLATALPIVLLPATVFRALRVVGAAPNVAIGGAAACGFVFAAPTWGLGVDAVFTKGLYTQPWAMLLWPLALAWSIRAVAGTGSLRRAAFWCFATGACHPFVAFCLPIALAVAPWWHTKLARSLGRAALLSAVVLAASSAMWLPILVHYDSFGGFPARVPDEVGIAPRAFASLLVRGRLLDEGRAPVLTIGLAIAVVAALRGRNPVLRALLLQGGIFAALVTLGPIVGKTRDDLVPAIRFLAPMQLAFAAAAGMGVAVATRRAARAVAVKRLASLGVTRATATAALLGGFALLVGTSVPRFAARVRTLDSAPFRVDRAERAELLAVLAKLPPGRVLSGGEWGTPGHFWMYGPAVHAGQPALRAYGGSALQSSANFVYLRTSSPMTHAALYGVRYVLARKGREQTWPGARVVHSSGRNVLLEVDGTGTFAPITIEGRARSDRAGRIEDVSRWLAGYSPKEARHLAIGDDRWVRRAFAPVATTRVLAEQQGPSRYAADVSIDDTNEAQSLLRASVTYHPGWRATVDGSEVPVRRVSPDVMAIEVPRGRHRVELRFERPGWTWVLWLADLALLAAAVVRSAVRGRPARAAATPIPRRCAAMEWHTGCHHNAHVVDDPPAPQCGC